MNQAQAVPESMRNLLAEIFEISPAEVTPGLSAGATPAWDSFGHLQAILAIEEAYGVRIDPQKVPELTSVGQLMQELESLGVSLNHD